MICVRPRKKVKVWSFISILTSAFSDRTLIGVISKDLIRDKLQSVDVYLNFSSEVSFFGDIAKDAVSIFSRATEVSNNIAWKGSSLFMSLITLIFFVLHNRYLKLIQIP